MDFYNRQGAACFERLPTYKVKYPRSFTIIPHHPPCIESTLYQTNPLELVQVDRRIHNDHWRTTNGVLHDEKIPSTDTFFPILNRAPSNQLMTYIFPQVEERMKKTYQGLMYNPKPVYNSVTKTDYKARWPIADFDYSNGPLVNVGRRYARVSQKTMTKPKFDVDDICSISKKLHPYLSQMKFDYINPTRYKDGYGCCMLYLNQVK